MKHEMQIWIGFVDGKPSIHRLPDYYDGVKHGNFFLSKRAARKCYEDVRPVVIRWYEVSNES